MSGIGSTNSGSSDVYQGMGKTHADSSSSQISSKEDYERFRKVHQENMSKLNGDTQGIIFSFFRSANPTNPSLQELEDLVVLRNFIGADEDLSGISNGENRDVAHSMKLSVEQFNYLTGLQIAARRFPFGNSSGDTRDAMDRQGLIAELRRFSLTCRTFEAFRKNCMHRCLSALKANFDRLLDGELAQEKVFFDLLSYTNKVSPADRRLSSLGLGRLFLDDMKVVAAEAAAYREVSVFPVLEFTRKESDSRLAAVTRCFLRLWGRCKRQ